MAKSSVSKALSRMLVPQGRRWSREVIDYIMSWKFSSAEIRRMQQLSAKANEKELTLAEHDEMMHFILLGNMITIAQCRVPDQLQRKTRAA